MSCSYSTAQYEASPLANKESNEEVFVSNELPALATKTTLEHLTSHSNINWMDSSQPLNELDTEVTSNLQWAHQSLNSDMNNGVPWVPYHSTTEGRMSIDGNTPWHANTHFPVIPFESTIIGPSESISTHETEITARQPSDGGKDSALQNATNTSDTDQSFTTLPTILPANGKNASSDVCLCRPSLMLLQPKVSTAVEKKQLDVILKITKDIIEGCQGLMDCIVCETTCIDLLVMMSVLQETHKCFDYISECRVEGAVKVSFGGYEFFSNDITLRAMLVTDLVQSAHGVLDAVDSRNRYFQQKFTAPDVVPSVCYSARANIAYLDTTIQDFREALNRITDQVARCRKDKPEGS